MFRERRLINLGIYRISIKSTAGIHLLCFKISSFMYAHCLEFHNQCYRHTQQPWVMHRQSKPFTALFAVLLQTAINKQYWQLPKKQYISTIEIQRVPFILIRLLGFWVDWDDLLGLGLISFEIADWSKCAMSSYCCYKGCENVHRTFTDKPFFAL